MGASGLAVLRGALAELATCCTAIQLSAIKRSEATQFRQTERTSKLESEASGALPGRGSDGADGRILVSGSVYDEKLAKGVRSQTAHAYEGIGQSRGLRGGQRKLTFLEKAMKWLRSVVSRKKARREE